uniref:Uncharacterized protein n=1 Tax=Panagrolaimus davidi TaxID=227884 RepID=A0A914P3I5_9BILA
MAKFLIICSIFIALIVTLSQSLEIWSHTGGFHSYSGDSPHSSIDHGSFSGSSSDIPYTDSSSDGCGPITAVLGLCSYNSEGGYQYQTPIYGNAGYTTGQINRMFDVNTGSNSGNYNGYSNNYWI